MPAAAALGGCSSDAPGGSPSAEASTDVQITQGDDGAILPLPDVACVLPPTGVVHTFAPTYDAVYQEVLGPTCGTEFCHGGSADFLQLSSPAEGYLTLVDAAAQGPQCAATGLKRVDPGHPETSLMYLKITNPPCGSKMPLEYGCIGILDTREIDQIRAWIACGAPDGDGGCGGDAGPTDAATSGDATPDVSLE